MHPYITEKSSFVSPSIATAKENILSCCFKVIDPNIWINKHPVLWLLYITKEFFNPLFMRAFTFAVSKVLCAEEVMLQQKRWNHWNKQKKDSVVSMPSKTKQINKRAPPTTDSSGKCSEKTALNALTIAQLKHLKIPLLSAYIMLLSWLPLLCAWHTQVDDGWNFPAPCVCLS